MAGIEALTYNCEKDRYESPLGGYISGNEVRLNKRKQEARLQEIRNELDAEKAYDPYNHRGSRT